MLPLHKGLQVTCCAIVMSLAVFAQSGNREKTARAQGEDSPDARRGVQVASSELPDSPGAALQKTQDDGQQNAAQTAPQPAQSTNGADQDPNRKIQRPVGTAAAEAPTTKGVTAAQPSGVAIAPAKQRRVRTIVIKVGAIMAAGAAIGTVVALTEATPSKPPGAH